MTLKQPVPGLRQFHNKSNDVAKIQLVVPAGDGIDVSDYVAAQLGPAFAEGPPPVVAEPEVEETPEPAKQAEPAPNKKAPTARNKRA